MKDFIVTSFLHLSERFVSDLSIELNEADNIDGSEEEFSS
jgi:hypothetical protein